MIERISTYALGISAAMWWLFAGVATQGYANPVPGCHRAPLWIIIVIWLHAALLSALACPWRQQYLHGEIGVDLFIDCKDYHYAVDKAGNRIGVFCVLKTGGVK